MVVGRGRGSLHPLPLPHHDFSALGSGVTQGEWFVGGGWGADLLKVAAFGGSRGGLDAER